MEFNTNTSSASAFKQPFSTTSRVLLLHFVCLCFQTALLNYLQSAAAPLRVPLLSGSPPHRGLATDPSTHCLDGLHLIWSFLDGTQSVKMGQIYLSIRPGFGIFIYSLPTLSSQHRSLLITGLYAKSEVMTPETRVCKLTDHVVCYHQSGTCLILATEWCHVGNSPDQRFSSVLPSSLLTSATCQAGRSRSRGTQPIIWHFLRIKGISAHFGLKITDSGTAAPRPRPKFGLGLIKLALVGLNLMLSWTIDTCPCVEIIMISRSLRY